MRVAVIHSFYQTQNSSGENSVVLDQVRQLRSMGLTVELISTSTDAEISQSGYALRKAFGVATGTGTSPEERLSAFRPDIVHVHNLFPNFSLRWLAKVRQPVVMTFHNFRLGCSNGLLYRDGKTCTHCLDQVGSVIVPVKSGCYRHSSIATLPVAVSRQLSQRLVKGAGTVGVTLSSDSDALVEQFMGSDFKRRQIPNFVEDFMAEPRPSHANRRSWLYVGRLSQEKGIKEMLDSWPEDEELTIVGGGPLESVVTSQCVDRANIRILGAIDRDVLRGLLDNYVGLVFPSRWVEVAPQVVVEALCAGVPVVALEGNSAATTVKESKAGAVYQRNDPRSLGSALRLVRRERDHLSTLGRKHYIAEWTPAVWSERIGDLYRTLIG